MYEILHLKMLCCIKPKISEDMIQPLLPRIKSIMIIDNLYIGTTPSLEESQELANTYRVKMFVYVDHNLDLKHIIPGIIRNILYDQVVHLSSEDITFALVVAITVASIITNERVENFIPAHITLDSRLCIRASKFAQSNEYEIAI